MDDVVGSGLVPLAALTVSIQPEQGDGDDGTSGRLQGLSAEDSSEHFR